ncbi:hypothetical protein FVE85_1982 [Porphyridium purpureum]|uniref:Uncharacterized protein n=1 Tax=Porphyridium purpureum TaxID=35688 RepID=A0A5J4YZG7_PORPP|nr:hypothetical protein FVE85_1982 [Porphyridium purpureum]|eukprot:POR6020..scf209_3
MAPRANVVALLLVILACGSALFVQAAAPPPEPPQEEVKRVDKMDAAIQEEGSNRGWEEWGEEPGFAHYEEKKNRRFKTHMADRMFKGWTRERLNLMSANANPMVFVYLKPRSFKSRDMLEVKTATMTATLRNMHYKVSFFVMDVSQMILVVPTKQEVLPVMAKLLRLYDFIDTISMDNNEFRRDMLMDEEASDDSDDDVNAEL